MKYLVFLLSLFCAHSIWAQDWYEIEVLIFEHNSNPYENLSDPERWPSDLSLGWPFPLLELDPDLTEGEEVEGAEDSAAPKPYTELPSDRRQLNNANYLMRVRDQYRLLWHKSWKAPLLPEENSPWILIQAGEQIGDHYRLEGALRIHLARYLHLHSDLWLTELQPIDAEEQTEFHWSQLPSSPLPMWPCLFVNDEWPDEARGLPDDYYEKPAPGDWYYPFGCVNRAETESDPQAMEDQPMALPMEVTGDILQPSPPVTTEADAENSSFDSSSPAGNNQGIVQTLTRVPFFLNRDNVADGSEPDNTGGTKPDFRTSDQGVLVGQGMIAESGDSNFSEPYPVKNIIHIQSRRRMRSEELHYIDHPKIGILAIIHPVEQPVLEAQPIEYISAPLPSSQSSN